MNYITEQERTILEKLFNEGAGRVESEAEYWVGGDDDAQGESFCLECCEKEVERQKKEDPSGDYIVDGGWDQEGDGTPFCETCHQLLSNSLTDWGCESEVEHFLLHGFDPKSDDDCRAMDEVILARGWEPFENQTWKDESEKEDCLRYFENLHTVCRVILKTLEETGQADNTIIADDSYIPSNIVVLL